MPPVVRFRYRNATTRRLYIRRLGVVVDPGDEFESPYEILDANYEQVTSAKPASPAKEE